MKKKSRVVMSLFLLALFTLDHSANAVEVLTDTGQRQTVVERTKQYAGSVDAIRVRNEMSAVFKKDLKRGNGSFLSGTESKCKGYTTSTCGLPCCGKDECSTVCKANQTLAHGNTCTSPYRTSRCGMSCCGKQDCDTVCDNYRTSTVSKKNCGGYVKTATGADCCGYEDCRERSCGGQTSVVSADFNKEMECCGAENCKDVKCDYQHSTEVISGGTVQCCGTKDCYNKYCEGQTSVDSKVDPSKTNLQCCGKINCHNVECDGYVTTKTPSGQVNCCGYDDCRNKECQYRLTAKNYKGEVVPCCGELECSKIEVERTYQEPANKCTRETYSVCVESRRSCTTYYGTATGPTSCHDYCVRYENRVRYKCCDGLQQVTTTLVEANAPNGMNCHDTGETRMVVVSGTTPTQYKVQSCIQAGAYKNNECIVYQKCAQYGTSCREYGAGNGSCDRGTSSVSNSGSYPIYKCCTTSCRNWVSCTPGTPGCQKTSGWYYKY